MGEKDTEYYIKRHIDYIINEFSFKNRSKLYPDKCPCYTQNKPCHDIENLNCFFCYCPFYDNSKVEGGCKRKSKAGKWLRSPKLPKLKIWDCSNCSYPHTEEFVRTYLQSFFSK